MGSAADWEFAVATCEKLQTCPFFSGQMKDMPAVSSLMKETYCLGDKMQCARYRVSTAHIAVPNDLLPNDVERARQLLGGRFGDPAK